MSNSRTNGTAAAKKAITTTLKGGIQRPLKIEGAILKGLVILYTRIPQMCRQEWVTVEEMYSRLVHFGVSTSLNTDILTKALTYHNKSNFLNKRKEGKTTFYRSAEFVGSETPHDQRNHNGRLRLPLPPDSKDFFLHNKEPTLDKINDALVKYGESLRDEQKKKRPKENQSLLDEQKKRRLKENVQSKVDNDRKRFRVSNFSSVPNNEGLGIFDIPMMVQFTHMVSVHASECQSELSPTKIDKTCGAAITQHWKCSKCGIVLTSDSCKTTKTSTVERGRGYSRPGPSINVMLPEVARENGVNGEKILGVLGGLGIKTSNRRNYRHAEKKVRSAIAKVRVERQEENINEHVEACKQDPKYETYRYEYNGAIGEATGGPVAVDGAGNKRIYGHRGQGDESATVAFSLVSKKPLTVINSRVSDV